MNAPDLSVDLCGVPLRNPVIAASGTFGYGIEFERLVNLDHLGGLVVKGLSREPIAGNAAPRLWEAEGGMMNAVGLQNVGAREFVRSKLPRLARFRTPIFANVFGFTADDYCETIRILEDAPGIAAYELNVSCPNTAHGGIFFSNDVEALSELVARAKKIARRPLFVKLSPNVAKIEPLAIASQDSGADAISLVNTFVALAIDARTRKPRIANGLGGLSGPAIKPIALRLVYQAARAVRIPVIGLGGIATGEDAAEFLIAGAVAVQVGTVSFWNPSGIERIIRGLHEFLREQRVARARDLTGTLEMPVSL